VEGRKVEIDPLILLSGSAVAVTFMVFFIRLIAGGRNAEVVDGKIRSYLALEETNVPIRDILISTDQKAALVHLHDANSIRLIRCFGDKYVMQNLEHLAINPVTQGIKIARQDISHPALFFSIDHNSPTPKWLVGGEKS